MMILAGDIGGTNTRLAYFEVGSNTKLRSVLEKTYPSAAHEGLVEIVELFTREHPQELSGAAFGVAGPVRDGRCVTPNLPWVVETRELIQPLHVPHVRLLNDLKANAYGLAHLGPEDVLVLHEGQPNQKGNAALISAGTGMGQAGLFFDGTERLPFATESGHADFAPRTPLEQELLAHLWKTHARVSYERVVSGPGLVNIYTFLRDTGHGTEPAWLTEKLRTGDAAAAISQAGLEGTSSLCTQALDLMVSVFGAEAGNMGLRLLALGGVYVGGGIAPKVLPKLKDPALFLAAFFAKGRMRELVESMPVRVVLNDRAALLGAAHCAALDMD